MLRACLRDSLHELGKPFPCVGVKLDIICDFRSLSGGSIMPRIIMPVFSQFPVEGAIIGRLLAGYGDLDFDLCSCIGSATDDLDIGV